MGTVARLSRRGKRQSLLSGHHLAPLAFCPQPGPWPGNAFQPAGCSCSGAAGRPVARKQQHENRCFPQDQRRGGPGHHHPQLHRAVRCAGGRAVLPAPGAGQVLCLPDGSGASQWRCTPLCPRGRSGHPGPLARCRPACRAGLAKAQAFRFGGQQLPPADPAAARPHRPDLRAAVPGAGQCHARTPPQADPRHPRAVRGNPQPGARPARR